MSPLKLALLLRAYSLPRPNQDIPAGQAYAPAMVEAINTFRYHGIFRGVASASILRIGYPSGPQGFAMLLTPKGEDLARRILGAAADFYREASGDE